MSLVNDMLKDLDAQNHKGTESSLENKTKTLEASAGLFPDDHKLGKSEASHSQLWSVVSGFLVFFVILGGYYFWQLQPGVTELDDVKPQEQPSQIDDVLLSSKILSVLGSSPEENTDDGKMQAGKEGSVTPLQNDTVGVFPQKQNRVVELVEVPKKPEAVANVVSHIQELLDAGNEALKLDRLQTPKDDNAYDRFMAVLALQPNNLDAQQGIEKIQQRYLGFITAVIKKGHFYKVPDLVKKARSVGVAQADIDSMLRRLPKKNSQAARDVIKHLDDTEEVKAVNQSDARQSVVEYSFSSKDLRLAQEAAKDYQDGRLIKAEKKLSDFVSQNPNSIFAYQKLFDVYLSQSRLLDAEKMIEQGSHLPGEIFSYLVAQVLTRRGDIDGAMRALQSHTPDLEKMPGYYALKAGLLHKMDKQNEAVVVYQQLIILDNTNPSYWLGLGVSMDAMSASQALAVFQKVVSLSPASAPYMGYVQQRIQALSNPNQELR